MASSGPQGQKRKRGQTSSIPQNVIGNEDGAYRSFIYKDTAHGKAAAVGGSSSRSSLQNGSQTNQVYRKETTKSIHTVRKELPIWSHQKDVRHALNGKDVLILVGETGSGKSTQVPQFLLDCQWCKGQIAITQPRRVAAISLARRVANEMGSTVGSSSPASKVGYSVRFDTSTSPAMRIKYLTEGMLLQELLRDPWLKNYNVVIVDEVHERSVNVDLILGFLRRIVTGEAAGENGREKKLKVVVMSATAETEALVEFFEDGFKKRESQKNQSVHNEAGDDHSESSWSGISTSEDEDTVDSRKGQLIPQESLKSAPSNKESKSINHNGEVESITINGRVIRIVPDRTKSPKSQPVAVQMDGDGKSTVSRGSIHVSTCFIQGRQYPVEIFYLGEPTVDLLYTSVKQIFQIHHGEPLPGDILVFLTGQEVIESLKKLVEDYSKEMAKDMPKILTLPLYAALSPHQQAEVFNPAKGFTRKVILSTNIAETSVTIPGVRYVIDTGKAKQKHFHNRLGLEALLAKTISRSSAIQRTGRAGREMPGKCWRLYTEETYQEMEKTSTPEMLRCDVSSALLTMKARGITDIFNFPLLDSPPRAALEQGLLHLLTLGALTDHGTISATGLRMSKLPLSPSLARVVVQAATHNAGACSHEVIDIVAALSVENIFLNPSTEEQREEAATARGDIFRRQGDLLTLLATVRGYAAEQTDRKAWAERRFVSHRAMRNVMNVRKQLRAQCAQQQTRGTEDGSDDDDDDVGRRVVSEEKAEAILKCFLRGFHANTARLMPDGSYKTFVGNQAVAIHPSSVLFGRKVEAIMFVEFVFTNKSYGRGVSTVQMDWIAEAVDENGAY